MEKDVLNIIANANNHGNSPEYTLQDWVDKVEKVKEEAEDIFRKYEQRYGCIHLVSSDYNIYQKCREETSGCKEFNR
jgi:hypothetical protein